jgi:hypothetical protein
MLLAGEAAIEYAQQVRKLHRRRSQKNSKQRLDDILMALERLKEAMVPIRSEIGRFPYGPQTDAAEARRQQIKDCSASIQSERRKLWKMLPKGARRGD